MQSKPSGTELGPTAYGREYQILDLDVYLFPLVLATPIKRLGLGHLERMGYVE